MEASVDTLEEMFDKMTKRIWMGNWEQTEAVAVHKEDPNEEVAVERNGALKNRCGGRCLAVRRRGRLSFSDLPAPRDVPVHKGTTVAKRRRKGSECNNGTRDRHLKQQLRPGRERADSRNRGREASCRVHRRAERIEWLNVVEVWPSSESEEDKPMAQYWEKKDDDFKFWPTGTLSAGLENRD
jgi:hypothetical protein